MLNFGGVTGTNLTFEPHNTAMFGGKGHIVLPKHLETDQSNLKLICRFSLPI